MGINYAQLRIILKVDNSFTSRSGKRTKVHARSCFVALCSKSSSSQSSEGELTWKGKNSPPGVGKKKVIPCAVFPSNPYSFIETQYLTSGRVCKR